MDLCSNAVKMSLAAAGYGEYKTVRDGGKDALFRPQMALMYADEEGKKEIVPRIARIRSGTKSWR